MTKALGEKNLGHLPLLLQWQYVLGYQQYNVQPEVVSIIPAGSLITALLIIWSVRRISAIVLYLCPLYCGVRSPHITYLLYLSRCRSRLSHLQYLTINTNKKQNCFHTKYPHPQNFSYFHI